MIKKGKTFFFLLSLTVSLLTHTIQSDESQKQNYILTGEKAIDKILLYTGFDKMEGFNKSLNIIKVDKTILVDTITPFLSDSINGKAYWRIEFKNVPLDLKNSEPGSKEESSRNFIAYLDTLGRLIKITSQVKGYDENFWHKPSSKVAEQQLLKSSEKFVGFPEQLPPVSLVKAVDEVMSDPLKADEIVALYVMRSHLGKEPQAVWDIHLYGVAHIGSIDYQDKPIYYRNHIRSTVDATTGKFIRGSATPYPVD